MCALAEILVKLGAKVSGSDVPDQFYTDAILSNLDIQVYEGFSPGNISDNLDFCIYSSAYSPETNGELAKAWSNKDLPVLKYTEALGELSKKYYSIAISGVHGKTTTTGLAGTIAKKLSLPGITLVGSAVSNFNGRSTYVTGNSYFIAETCEYKRNFLDFFPDYLVVTSIESDHQDYYPSYLHIFQAFLDYAKKLPNQGTLLYCADDDGASELAKKLNSIRPDVQLIQYGFSAKGRYKISEYSAGEGSTFFQLSGFTERFEIHIPGKHTVLNAAAAIAVNMHILEKAGNTEPEQIQQEITNALKSFRGSKRRSEIIRTDDDIIHIDDYAHHPTAIRTTLAGIREYYQNNRIIVDFMSHTYSRTMNLLSDFAKAFSASDILILNKIYSSAREEKPENFSGENLFKEVKKYHNNVHYCPEIEDAVEYIQNILKPGDVFITMGAGDNWKIHNYMVQERKG